MIVVSGHGVTIVISSFGVGKIGNQIVVGFKVLAKHVFGGGSSSCHSTHCDE